MTPSDLVLEAKRLVGLGYYVAAHDRLRYTILDVDFKIDCFKIKQHGIVGTFLCGAHAVLRAIEKGEWVEIDDPL